MIKKSFVAWYYDEAQVPSFFETFDLAGLPVFEIQLVVNSLNEIVGFVTDEEVPTLTA